MNKKIYVILGILIIVIVVILVIVLKTRSNQKNYVKAQKIKAQTVNDLKVQDPVLNNDGQILSYYDLKKGDLFSLNLASNQTDKLSENMDQPISIIWSPDRTQAIIKIQYDKYKFEKFGGPFVNPDVADQTTMLWHYDLKTKKYTMLNASIYNPAPLAPLNPVWTTDSQQILYHYLDSNNKISTLNISDPNGQNWRNLGNIPENVYSLLLYQENARILYYSTLNIESGQLSIFQFDVADQKTNPLISDADFVLPIDDSNFAYTQSGKSFIFNYAEQTSKELPIQLMGEKTFLSSDKTKLIAVDKEANQEHIFIIDIATQKMTVNIDPNLAGSDISELILANQKIFFVNDKFLYKIADFQKSE